MHNSRKWSIPQNLASCLAKNGREKTLTKKLRSRERSWASGDLNGRWWVERWGMPPSGRAVQCTCTVPKCHFLQQPWSDCGRKTSYFKLILAFLLSFWFLDFMPVLSSLRSVFKPQKLQKKYPQSHFADLEGRGPAFLQSRKSCKKRKTGFRGKHLKKKVWWISFGWNVLAQSLLSEAESD